MRGVCALTLLTLVLPAWGAPLFEQRDPLTVTLTGPLTSLMRAKGEERPELPFTLILEDVSALDVKLRTRGNFRREECKFAPLRLNFKREETGDSPFSGQDKLKLVTHCKSGGAYQTNTLEEYIAYRIFNLITDTSFRVRLLHTTYVDSDHPDARATTRWAFVIEDSTALAERLGGTHVAPHHVSSSALDAPHATRVALFQYLIANTDYSPIAALEGRSCCHNMKLIRTSQTLFSIPYDFDMSGLVNAAYAGPNPVVQEDNARKRIYRGFCTDRDTLKGAIDQIRLLRDEVLVLFKGTPGFEPAQIKRDMAFIDRFFEKLNEENATSRFERSCR
jgi:hypothetical protein